MTTHHSPLTSNTSHLLVTGGAGFIGANFVNYWLNNYPDDRVVVLDALTYAGNLASLEPAKNNPNFHFVHGDICNQELAERLLRDESIDTIVHFAAESHVDRSIHGPDTFIQTNIVGTHSLLKAAKSVWLDSHSSLLRPQSSVLKPYRFHHVSTDEVYGSLGPEDPPFTEHTPYAPNSPYSASKAASDHLVRAYHHTHDLNITTSNCSNNYGPYQFPEKLIPLFIINILEGKPLPVYGDGLNIRDWLYVEDHCKGIDLILQKGRPGEVYNIGGNCEKTNLEMVETLCKNMDERKPSSSLTSYSSLLTFVKDRPGHDRRYAIDSSKIKKELGFEPYESFETGIRKTIDWYLQNESWWRAVMDGSYREWLDRQYGQKHN